MVVDDLQDLRLVDPLHRLALLVVVHQDQLLFMQVHHVSAGDYADVVPIVIDSGSAEQMERAISKGDIVIVANRRESQLTAIEMGAGCVVVCAGCKVSRTICMLAEEQGC